MAFTHVDKGPGDLIRSADWNEMGREIARLDADKLDLAGGQSVTGTLGVRGDLTVGTPNAGAQLRLYRKQEDARDAAHGALVVGTDAASSASLRVGYAQAYSWLQGQGQTTLALNPRGGDVGVGTDTPRSRLSVAGALAVGAAYASGSAAPANSLVVEGSVGVGTASPQARLDVEGAARVAGGLDVGGALAFGQTTRQMLNLWGTSFAIGVQANTTYFRSDGNFAFYRGGAHADGALAPGAGGTAVLAMASSGSVGVGTASPQARLHVAGGNLRLDSGQEILFADGGQIRSTDDSHRILFRRAENKLELREYGDIVFSPGATDGKETSKAVLLSSGFLGLGTAAPRSALDTGRGVMSGAANDYVKAQFTLSGGGAVSWADSRLQWTNRFIAISANRGTSLASGYVDIYQPTADIPAAQVFDGKARSASAAGVLLTDWDALYAVHAPGGAPGDVTFRVVNYKNDFNAPSNWLLVAVRNGDDGSVKLGTGEILGRGLSWANGALLSTDQGGSLELGGNNAKAAPAGATPFIDFHYGNGRAEDYNVRIINNAEGTMSLVAPRVSVSGKLSSGNARAMVSATNHVETKSTTWVDLPDMSVTVDTGANAVLFLFKTGGVQMAGGSNSARGRFRLLVDDGQVAFTLHEFHNGGWELHDVTLVHLAWMAAGRHTARVQWYAESSTLSASWYGDQRSLMAVEL